MRFHRSSVSRTGALLLAFLALAVPLARGGVDPWAEAAATALALAALAAAAWERAEVPRAAVALLAVDLVAAALLVPLPPALQPLSPGAVRVFDVSLRPLGLYPAARPLSLDPAASAHALAKGIACTAAFAAAWMYGDARRRKDRILAGLGLSGAAVAVVVLGAALVGAGELLASRVPFVNPNHLAGFMSLTSFVALGLAFRSHGQTRALWAMAFVLGGAVVFLSLSRGGIGAFFVGAAVFVVLQAVARKRRAEAAHPLRQAAVVGVLATAVGVAAFLALDPVLAELRTLRGAADDLKVRLLAPAAAVVHDFPLTGVGPGAFASVFPGYQSESSTVTFTHLENEWLQPMIDLGVPTGLLLIGTFAWIWASAARRREVTSPDIGLLAGTAALAAHNVFDFSLEILGVALPFAIAMGLLARSQPRISVRRWVLVSGLLAATLASAAALVVASSHDLDVDRDRVEHARGATASVQAARAALAWHPADWVPQALAGARVAAERGCGEALPWFVRAMALDPGAPEPHLASARCLAGRNDSAARREYRLAILYGLPALDEAARRYPPLENLLEIAPVTPDGLLALGGVLAAEARQADAAAVLGRLVDEFADDRGVLPLARAKAALREHSGALELARRHESAHPSDPEGWLLASDALRHLGREEEAGTEVERGLAAAPGSPPLLTFLAGQAMAAGRWSEGKRLAEEIAPRTPAELADKHLLAARALAGQGRLSEALDRGRSAAAALPDHYATLIAVADYAAAAGRLADALDVLRRAAALPGAPKEELVRRISELETAAAAEQQRALLRDALQGSAP